MISNAEWEVLRVVWTKGQVTSKQIIAVLASKKDWSESTIKTLIGRLVDKGILLSRREGRSYLYWTEVSEDDANLASLKGELDKICVTKHADLLGKLLGETPMTAQDIKTLQDILSAKQALTEVTCDCTPGQCRCHETGAA
ncbi:CopY/TcrY family copper transport repressor [Streptococcus dentasini]